MAVILVPTDVLPETRIWQNNVYVPQEGGSGQLPQGLLDSLAGIPPDQQGVTDDESKAKIERLTAEVNRLQDIIDEMTEDKADAKSNEHFANMNEKPKAKK